MDRHPVILKEWIKTPSIFDLAEVVRRTDKREVGEIAKKYGIRVIGPNCLGIMSFSKDNIMNSTFLKVTPKYGNIALISQSGAICAATVEDAEAQDIGFSKVDKNIGSAIAAELMRLGLCGEEVFRKSVFARNELDIFALGVNQQVAVLGADGAVAAS